MPARIARSAAALVAALVLGAAGAQSALAEPATPQTRLEGVVNVNTATPEELELLPGIGPAKALAVVEHRKQHGPFKSVDDLAGVPGIGERALERIRAHCVVQGKTTAQPEP